MVAQSIKSSACKAFVAPVCARLGVLVRQDYYPCLARIVLSETAGAPDLFARALKFFRVGNCREASIDGEDQSFGKYLYSGIYLCRLDNLGADYCT